MSHGAASRATSGPKGVQSAVSRHPSHDIVVSSRPCPRSSGVGTNTCAAPPSTGARRRSTRLATATPASRLPKGVSIAALSHADTEPSSVGLSRGAPGEIAERRQLRRGPVFWEPTAADTAVAAAAATAAAVSSAEAPGKLLLSCRRRRTAAAEALRATAWSSLPTASDSGAEAHSTRAHHLNISL